MDFVKDKWDFIVKSAAAVGGAIAGLLGGFDVMLRVLVIFMIADYVSGWVVAIMGHSLKTPDGHLNSQIGFKGIARKCFILLMVLLATTLDQAIEQQIFRSMVVWFYIANEGLSVLENLALAGVPFPAGIKTALEQIKEKNDKPEEDPEEKFPEG